MYRSFIVSMELLLQVADLGLLHNFASFDGIHLFVDPCHILTVLLRLSQWRMTWQPRIISLSFLSTKLGHFNCIAVSNLIKWNTNFRSNYKQVVLQSNLHFLQTCMNTRLSSEGGSAGQRGTVTACSRTGNILFLSSSHCCLQRGHLLLYNGGTYNSKFCIGFHVKVWTQLVFLCTCIHTIFIVIQFHGNDHYILDIEEQIQDKYKKQQIRDYEGQIQDKQQ